MRKAIRDEILRTLGAELNRKSLMCEEQEIYLGQHPTKANSIMEALEGPGRVVLFVAGMGLFGGKNKNQAATYSPGARRPQYHRRWRA